MSEILDVGTWKTGALDTNPRCFDLLCTGKVQINSNDYKLKLDISAADRIPSFFTKNSAGEVVFAEPKPMCTIKMPRGHWGTIIVRLKSVSTEQTSAEGYVCLGVKEDGEITGVLYGDGAFKYIDMTDESNVELVPLISVTKLPEYTKAEIGTKVTFSNTNFDFGTVYRVTIDDEQKIEWSGVLKQIEGKRLADIVNEHWYNECNGVGVGPVKGKGVRMLAINRTTGKIASSTDGARWDDEGSVLNQDETIDKWQPGLVYGNDIWCAITRDGIVKYSIDEAETWLKASTSPVTQTEGLGFGNGIFITVANNKKVYASVDANIWEVIGEISYESDTIDIRVLHYDDHNGRWICATWGGIGYSSENGGRTWEPIITTLGLNKIADGWPSCCYCHGYFYAICYGSSRAARSSDGNDWSRIVNFADTYYNISFYNNRIYVFHSDGIRYYVGTFK